MVVRKKPAADAGRSKKETKKEGERYLIVQGPNDEFYIAAHAHRLPGEYAERLRGYRPTAGDGVFQSPRSFLIEVPGDDRLMRILGGVLPRK